MPKRRAVLGATMGLVAATVGGAAKADGAPEVTTNYGKILGTNTNGVFVFKGVPYGASTAGKNRFMPPVAPEPWPGVRGAALCRPLAAGAGRPAAAGARQCLGCSRHAAGR